MSSPHAPHAPMLPVTGCVVIVGSLLGVLTNTAKLALHHGWQPLPFLFWSTLFGGLCLWGVAIASRQPPALGKRHLLYYVIAGIFSFAVPNGLSFLAIQHVGASFIAFCLAFPPLLTYVLAVAMRLEPPALLRTLGIILGLTGAGGLALSKGIAQQDALLWVAMAVASPVFIAIGNIYRSLHWPQGSSPLSLAPGMMVAAALEVGLASLLAGENPVTSPAGVGAWGDIAIQSAILAITYAVFFYLQKLGGPVALSQIGWVAAIVGSTIAVLVLGEVPPAGLGIAMVLIVLGIVLVSRRRAA